MAKTTATKTLPLHLVTIKRGSEEVADTVTKAQLRILRAQHPPENIKMVTEGYDVLTVPNDANLMHDQLCRKYDSKNVKVVERVFPTPEHLGEFMGMAVPFEVDAGDIGPQKSEQHDHGREARIAAAKGDGKNKSKDKDKDGGSDADPSKLGDAAAAGDASGNAQA